MAPKIKCPECGHDKLAPAMAAGLPMCANCGLTFSEEPYVYEVPALETEADEPGI